MLWKIVSVVALTVCCGLTFAGQPGLHLGAGLVWYPSLLVDMPDSVGGLKPSYAFEDIFTGATVTAEYWPHRMVGARITLAQLQFFKKGGSAFALLPRVGVDFLVEPPVDWRVRPFVAAGLSGTWYQGGTNRGDARFVFDPDVHLWIGPGLSVRVTRRLEVRAEAGVYDFDRYYLKDPAFGYYQWTNSGFVVDHALVGLVWACRETAH
jgi:hypothetical protein